MSASAPEAPVDWQYRNGNSIADDAEADIQARSPTWGSLSVIK